MKTAHNHLIYIGSPPTPFETDEFLYQLRTLMTMEYDVEEDKICEFVAAVVGTYHPAVEHVSEYKGSTYDKQVEIVAQK